MEERHGSTATLTQERPAETVAGAPVENRPLTIGISGPLPDEGKPGSVGKWVGRVVHGMLKDQPNIEIERVVVHIHLKDPEAWED